MTTAKKQRRKASASTVPFEELLRSELQDREVAIGYINALLAEDDEQGVLLALRDIADAVTMGTIAKNTGLNRESLYKVLSGKRDPRLGTFFKVMKALGISLRAYDAQMGLQDAVTTSTKAGASYDAVKDFRVLGEFSVTIPTAYVARTAFNYRPGVCPLDPRKRCLDIVPCAPEGAATEFPAFSVPIWPGSQMSMVDEEMAYAG